MLRLSVGGEARAITLTSRGKRGSLRILVTGSSGVLGRNLTHALESLGHRVVPFDIREPDQRSTPSSRLRDIRDPSAVRDVVKAVDGVVHLAAVSRVAPAEADPSRAHSVNVGGTQTLLEALRLSDSPAWLIFASSREVYGEPTALPVDEEHRLNPKGVYGRTKAEGELAVRKHCENEARRALILRLTNVYGDPTDYPERVIPTFVSAALQGEPLEVRGPGILLDFLHASDAIQAVLEASRHLETRGPGVDVINIASGHGITLGDLAKKVIEVTGSSSLVRTTSTMGWASSAYVGNVAKAARTLSWKPTVDFERGLRTLVGECDKFRREQGPRP